ncbi:cytochrome c oxidase accessory protein CcoG [Rhodoferax sp. U11-2br]|uniref:cytochrome c oxidase accessory protein CcoG n=1 Tax=Rhodoferax sp. U11-2br TaxID=2838878 RepID=UPI001BEBE604|nr:cytochrome c oxidase accessory protein CcoG [Rhodoferax sp. U11-2br]MBT3065606.1 cytochrome c oxidase accessory protein CcoG [Rhodoferax sp. U11-2br]
MSKTIIPILPVADSATEGGLFVMDAKNKIYVRAVTGRFAAWRWAAVWLTQLVFYGLPWLSWNDRQAVLFDLGQQRFYLFGLALYPQDLIYLAVLLMLAALLLFFVTAVAGRIWCGFACPQTVYTEIFLWVEQRLEGSHHARKRLDAMPWTPEKLARKGGKQATWLLISLWTGFTFVGYFTPIQTLGAQALTLAWTSWELFWVGFYGLATYVNAGYLREQMCKHACPYARFQGAMMDRDTLVIGYDTTRGEARGARSRSADPKALGLGDCIDCTLCVQVCPTGIDIRDGLQSNCIGCAACIDVCDTVMGQMNYPKGLIRYSTQNGLANGWDQPTMRKRVLRKRVLIYAALLLAAVLAFVSSVALRSPMRVDVVRDRGVMARVVNGGAVENVYRLHVMNATEEVQRYRVTVLGHPDLSMGEPLELALGPVEARTVPLSVRLPFTDASNLAGQTLPIQLEVTQLGSDEELVKVREKTTFHVPQ